MNRSLLILLVFLFPLYSFGQTFTVDDDGPADFNNIQDAVLAASDTDEVVIADGIYTGYGNRDIDFYGKAITVRSQNGPENCIIDCNGTLVERRGGFLFQNGEEMNSVLDGFTITNGTGLAEVRRHFTEPVPDCNERLGGAIYFYNSSPVIQNCVFANNNTFFTAPDLYEVAVGQGGAIYCFNSNPILTNCVFNNNKAMDGGGMFNDCNSNPVLTNCLFETNRAWYGMGGSGGGISNWNNSSPLLINCSFIRNYSWAGSAIYNGPNCDTIMINCTLTKNYTAYSSAIYNDDESAPNLTNCILWGNTVQYDEDSEQIYGGSPILNYSCVQNWTGALGGVGNFGYDPCFVDPDSDDFHLRLDSPCIDAGDPNSDYSLEPQPNGNRINMGAYGNTAEAAITIDSDGDGITDPRETQWGLDHDSNDTDNDGLTDDYEVCYDGNCLDYNPYPAGGDLNGNSADTDEDRMHDGWELVYGDFLDPLDATDAILDYDGDGYTNLEEFMRNTMPDDPNSYPQPIIIYVDDDASGANTGLSWDDAFSYLQDALAKVVHNDQIWVAQGSCRPDQGIGITPGDRTASFHLINGVAMYGGFAAGGTWQDRDPNLYHTVLTGDLNGDDANFLPDPWEPLDPNRAENSYHVVTGSGTDETTVLDGFTITGGNADGFYQKDNDVGGGMYNDSGSPTVNNCTFKANSAPFQMPYRGLGAGMYNVNNSNPTLTSCTFVCNLGQVGGGIFNSFDSGPTLTNCTFRNNFADTFGGGAIYGGIPEIIHCRFTDNYARQEGGGALCFCDGSISDCEITGNHVFYEGNGGGLAYCGGPISDSIIANNSASYAWGGGGGIYGCSGLIINCIIINNSSYGGGYGEGWLGKGGGLSDCGGPISNCVIAGNTVTSDCWWAPPGSIGNQGGGLYNCDGPITNCTIVGNIVYETTGYYYWGAFGGGLAECNGTIYNCAIWGNRASLDPQVCSCCDPNYCCIQDFTGGGTANINSDPCFAVAGYWDDAGTPDDANDDFWVGGDYHLKSAFGRWDSVKQSWVYDDVNSPGIDAGDPNFDWTGEFWPHGKRINMGAYGGTVQASMSSSALGNAADLNNDANVDMTDYSLLAAKWRLGQARTIPPANITVDGDLADWTGHIEWIPLDKTYFGQPDDILNAKFALRWNKQAGKIYAAVIVDDNDHVFTDEYISWDAGDRIEIYSQGDAEGGTGFWDPEYPNWDSAQQYMIAPDTAGGTWATWGNGRPLGPDVGLEYAAVVDANRIIYEIAVKQFNNYGTFSGDPTVQTHLHIGHTVGFDVVADTRWTGGFGMLSENLMMDKFKNDDSFAKYVLTDRYPDWLYGPLIGDIDRNQVVDISDVYTLAQNWLAQD